MWLPKSEYQTLANNLVSNESNEGIKNILNQYASGERLVKGCKVFVGDLYILLVSLGYERPSENKISLSNKDY